MNMRLLNEELSRVSEKERYGELLHNRDARAERSLMRTSSKIERMVMNK